MAANIEYTVVTMVTSSLKVVGLGREMVRKVPVMFSMQEEKKYSSVYK